jgi:hypothetical protein
LDLGRKMEWGIWCTPIEEHRAFQKGLLSSGLQCQRAISRLVLRRWGMCTELVRGNELEGCHLEDRRTWTEVLRSVLRRSSVSMRRGFMILYCDRFPVTPPTNVWNPRLRERIQWWDCMDEALNCPFPITWQSEYILRTKWWAFIIKSVWKRKWQKFFSSFSDYSSITKHWGQTMRNPSVLLLRNFSHCVNCSVTKRRIWNTSEQRREHMYVYDVNNATKSIRPCRKIRWELQIFPLRATDFIAWWK